VKKYILAAVLILMAVNSSFAEEEQQNRDYDLGKIVVTPSRLQENYKNSTASISVAGEDDIKDSGVNEIHQILETFPSVDILQYGSNGATKTVHTRGASSSQVIMLVDGRPTNTPRDGVVDFNKIPLNNIERIEVLRGPASNIYGSNAMGGVINVITKSGKKNGKSELTVKYGSEDTRITQMSTQGKENLFDYFLSGGWQKSIGFRDNSDYKAWDFNSKIGIDINAENKLNFSTGYWSSEVGTPGKITNEDPDDRQNAWSDYVDLTWDGLLWQDSNILFKLYQAVDRLEFIESTAPTYDIAAHLTKVYGTTLQISQMWFDVFRTTFGVDGQEHKIDSSTSKKHEYNFKAAYLETEVTPLKGLNIKGGARIDDYSNFGNRTSPSASFSWLVFDMLKFHGLYGKSFRAPTFNDLYWPREDWGIYGGVEGNVNLKPEIAKSYEAGISVYPLDSVELDLTYFNSKYKDLISWQSDTSWWWRPTNLDKALIHGIEMNMDLQPFKRLKTNLNYTYLEAQDTTTCKWLIYRPHNTYKGSVVYDLTDKLKLFFSGRYVTKRFADLDNTVFLKEYFVADSNISYKINDLTEFTLTVNNIFDRDYQQEYDYPMQGTSFLLGTRLQY